ncbi:MAG: TonB family protein [Candidatus Hydrothermales bacterium]
MLKLTFLAFLIFYMNFCVRVGREVPKNPEKGGILAIGIVQDFESLVPIFPSPRQDNSIFDLIFCPLIRVEKNKVYPGIASEWEFSEDLKTITFYLRKDAKWHDGKPVTAGDFVFSYKVITSPGSTSLLRANFKFVKNVEKLSDYILKIEFTNTYSSQLIDCEIYPLPEHILKDVDNIRNSEFLFKPIGNGPYRVAEYKRGDFLILEKFDEFFEKTGYLDRIVFKIYPSPFEVAEALKMDIVDVGFSLIPEVILDGLRDYGNGKVKNYESNRVIFVGWNLKRKPFDNIDLRSKISGFINVDDVINDVFKGYGTKARSIIPPSIWAYDSNLIELKGASIDELVSTLNQIGFTRRKPLELSIIYDNTQRVYEKIAEKIKIDLEKTEVIKVNPLPLDPFTFISRLMKLDFDIFLLSYPLDEKADISPLFSTDGIFNFMGYSNKKVDSLLNLSMRTLNRKNAKKMLNIVQKILLDDLPITPLVVPQEIFAFSNRVKNIDNFTPELVVSNLDLVWIPSQERVERVSFEIVKEKVEVEIKEEVVPKEQIPERTEKVVATTTPEKPQEPKPQVVPRPEVTAEEILQARIVEEAIKKEEPPISEKPVEGKPVSPPQEIEKPIETPPPQQAIPTVLPVVKYEVKPTYPEIAKKLGARGSVFLRVLVDENGKVKDVKILKSSGYDFLDNSAVEAAKGYIFEPAKDQFGNPIAVWVPLTIRF